MKCLDEDAILRSVLPKRRTEGKRIYRQMITGFSFDISNLKFDVQLPSREESKVVAEPRAGLNAPFALCVGKMNWTLRRHCPGIDSGVGFSLSMIAVVNGMVLRRIFVLWSF